LDVSHGGDTGDVAWAIHEWVTVWDVTVLHSPFNEPSWQQFMTPITSLFVQFVHLRPFNFVIRSWLFILWTFFPPTTCPVVPAFTHCGYGLHSRSYILYHIGGNHHSPLPPASPIYHIKVGPPPTTTCWTCGCLTPTTWSTRLVSSGYTGPGLGLKFRCPRQLRQVDVWSAEGGCVRRPCSVISPFHSV